MRKSEKADFTVQVLSDNDNEYLTAEIYYGNFLICIVNTEFGDFGVSFYSDPKINYQQEFIQIKYQIVQLKWITNPSIVLLFVVHIFGTTSTSLSIGIYMLAIVIFLSFMGARVLVRSMSVEKKIV